MNRVRRALTGLMLGTSLCASVAKAQSGSGVTFEFREDGSDVMLIGFGSYNLLGAERIGAGGLDGYFAAEGFAVGGPTGPADFYALTLNPGAFSSSAFVDGTDDTGDLFGLDFLGFPGTPFSGFIMVPLGYSGGPLSGSTRFAGQSFASLGLTEGSYAYAIPNTAIHVNIVPEPGVATLLGVALLLGGVAVRRRGRTLPARGLA